jgi:hypothetical protein
MALAANVLPFCLDCIIVAASSTATVGKKLRRVSASWLRFVTTRLINQALSSLLPAEPVKFRTATLSARAISHYVPRGR